jgi:iron complex outermembrane receptor protein
MTHGGGSGVRSGARGRNVVALAVATAIAAAASGAARAQEQQGEEQARSGVVRLDDVVVVGSRLRSAGAGEGHLPIAVIDAEEIARVGASNIADVLDYLPSKTFGVNEQINSSGALTVQLRGLALGNTLVLINGRRVVSTATLTGAGAGFNLNTVPLSAVERIEVLSDSSSAVYGADAVGGVVNIVLKKFVPAPFASLYYGAANGGADERRASAGFGVDGDRFNFSLLGDYFERDYLMGTERDQTSNQDFRGQGGTDFRVPTGRLANITSVGGVPLTGLASPAASVPAGSTGVLTPADFAGTAGNVNRTSLAQFTSVVPQTERASAMAIGDLTITDNLRLFSEVFFSKQEDQRKTTPATTTALPTGNVPANQAFNPFDQPVNVNYVFPDAQINFSENELIRGVLGLRGGIGAWDWEIYGLNSSENGITSDANQANQAGIAAALRSTDPATALNVFTDAPLSPAIAALVYLPQTERQFSSDASQASAFVRGSLFEMPAGPLSVVVGGEWRREGIHFEGSTPATFVTQDRTVNAGFAEARIPLVDEGMTVPLLHSLAATLAVRYDDYSDFGDTTNPQFGLEWNLFSSFLVRASYGEAYRAPSLFDLYQTATVLNVPQNDPRRGNAILTIPITIAGNPNLQPEESTTFSTGFVYTPEQLPATRLAVTYWNIEQEQRLQRFTQATLLANEAFFPERVVRGAPTPADIAAGFPGRLLSLDLSNVNAGNLETDGIDLELTASWQTGIGTFAPSIAATQVLGFDAADFPSTASVDRLGAANTQGAIPETRVTGSLAWNLKGFGLVPTVRYISSYDDVAQATNVRTGGNVESQTLIDLQATLDFETAFNAGVWTRGLNLRLGVLNLTDEDAPFALVSGPAGYDTSQGDLRRRFSYVMLQKTF